MEWATVLTDSESCNHWKACLSFVKQQNSGKDCNSRCLLVIMKVFCHLTACSQRAMSEQVRSRHSKLGSCRSVMGSRCGHAARLQPGPKGQPGRVASQEVDPACCWSCTQPKHLWTLDHHLFAYISTVQGSTTAETSACASHKVRVRPEAPKCRGAPFGPRREPLLGPPWCGCCLCAPVSPGLWRTIPARFGAISERAAEWSSQLCCEMLDQVARCSNRSCQG